MRLRPPLEELYEVIEQYEHLCQRRNAFHGTKKQFMEDPNVKFQWSVLEMMNKRLYHRYGYMFKFEPLP